MAANQGDRKIIAFEEEAQNELANGLRIGANCVALTLGPCGSNVLIDRKNRTPIMVDDGITALNNLILENELQNLGILSLIDAANKTSEYVGDGTSTTPRMRPMLRIWHHGVGVSIMTGLRRRLLRCGICCLCEGG